MDPAGPFFRDSSPDDRLDATDASFVSVVHSNMASIVLKGFGNPQKSGDVDVFLNGGEIQPGCEPLDLAGEVVASGLSPASLVSSNGSPVVKFDCVISFSMFTKKGRSRVQSQPVGTIFSDRF